MTAPETAEALSRLETQLCNMDGIAQCLMGLEPDDVDGKLAVLYLGGQLALHHRAARETFDEILRR